MGKIAVVGSINMDMTVSAERIPAKGETVYGTELVNIPGGKGANQAVAAAKLGADVIMFGCVGDDSIGRAMIKNLEISGVNTKYVRNVSGVSTGTAIITVGENDNTIVVVPGANEYVTKDYVDNIKDVLLMSDIVLLQHEIPQETIEYVIRICAENNVRTLLNPAPARQISSDILEIVDYITPNEHEAEIIFGYINADKMMEKYPEKLIITQGQAGVSVCEKNGKMHRIPARKARVVDTTGAGDTLNGAFAVEISKGKKVSEALVFANVAASLSTEKYGAQTGMPSLLEVENELCKMNQIEELE